MGPAFVKRVQVDTGADIVTIARAYVVAREVCQMQPDMALALRNWTTLGPGNACNKVDDVRSKPHSAPCLLLAD